MKNPSFIPGPWQAREFAKNEWAIEGAGQMPHAFVAPQVHHTNADEDDPVDVSIARANARLIAAAPELLAAAEMVVAHFNGMKRGALSPSLTKAVDASNAAIAKAKGIR
jgi:hypothetical protein